MRTNAFIGQKFGTLMVKEILPSESFLRRNGKLGYTVKLLCECRCGVIVIKKKKVLVEGDSQHCGKIECKRIRMRAW